MFGRNPSDPQNHSEVNHMLDMKQVGIRISKLRKSAGMTQMEMADRLGISFQAISNWERGVSHS